MNLFVNLIVTFFYLGKMPKAPGTWGSFGGLLLWLLIPENFLYRLGILIVLLIIGFISCEITLKRIDEADPSYIVIDEVIGLWIALLFAPKSLFFSILGFILFRFFDIIKPSFIYSTQSINGSWGVLLDDIISGLFVLVILNGFII